MTSVLQESAETQRDIRDFTLEQLQIQKNSVRQQLSDIEKECHQLFRLTDTTKDATYEWYKERVQDRVQGTCIWFLEHENYRHWLNQDAGPLLVSADPGCGKSVLAKYLVDYALPRSATICYFFFKEQDQNTVRQALCALMHQIFSQKPSLIHHASDHYAKNGEKLTKSTILLWNILENVVHDPEAGSVIIVLDALDECAESEFANLMRNIGNLFSKEHFDQSKLKVLFTSRPYEQIMSEFRDLLATFPYVHIPGEEESDAISREVNCVIDHQVQRLPISAEIKRHLAHHLVQIEHRTYLWVYLVFDYLKTEGFKKTAKGVVSAIATLPKSVNQAYEKILSRSRERPMVQKALSIILAASRPLTIFEMNVAMNVDDTTKYHDDLDLEEETDFKSRLRSWCGLLVSTHHGKIYFLHQTIREFLLENPALSATNAVDLRWQHSFRVGHVHAVLAEVCIRFLNIINCDTDMPKFEEWRKGTYSVASTGTGTSIFPFVGYAACWLPHFRMACEAEDDVALASLASMICEPSSKAFPLWVPDYKDKLSTALLVASCYGLDPVVKLQVEQGADLELANDVQLTPLMIAVERKNGRVAKLLVEAGANLDSRDVRNRTPLAMAAQTGQPRMAKLLLEAGADLESRDDWGRTPLAVASLYNHSRTVKFLLAAGAFLESRDVRDKTPLSLAKSVRVVRVLLKGGAYLEAKDKEGWTPLWQAVNRCLKPIVQSLLNKGANKEAKDEAGITPLIHAARINASDIVSLLLESGANLENVDNEGRTALWWATATGSRKVVQSLLEKGANIETKDKGGCTPLMLATKEGHIKVVRLLRKRGAELKHMDNDGRTALWWTTKEGWMEAAGSRPYYRVGAPKNDYEFAQKLAKLLREDGEDAVTSDEDSEDSSSEDSEDSSSEDSEDSSSEDSEDEMNEDRKN